MSDLRVNTLRTANGVEVYTAKAWVNFNGTGTVAIRASGNVSSITDNGTGDYTVNFTNAMPDANYSFSGSGRETTTNSVRSDFAVAAIQTAAAISTSSLRVTTVYASVATVYDPETVCVTIFR